MILNYCTFCAKFIEIFLQTLNEWLVFVGQVIISYVPFHFKEILKEFKS